MRKPDDVKIEKIFKESKKLFKNKSQSCVNKENYAKNNNETNSDSPRKRTSSSIIKIEETKASSNLHQAYSKLSKQLNNNKSHDSHKSTCPSSFLSDKKQKYSKKTLSHSIDMHKKKQFAQRNKFK